MEFGGNEIKVGMYNNAWQSMVPICMVPVSSHVYCHYSWYLYVMLITIMHATALCHGHCYDVWYKNDMYTFKNHTDYDTMWHHV